jgi:hypothetical protein
VGHAADLARKVGAVLAALFLIATPAYACVDPNRIQVEYGSMSFTQTRHLNGVARPLTARGRATIAAERVDWHVTTPVDALTTITPSGITQSIDGGPPQRVNAQAGGDAFLSSAGLFDMLVGNFDALEQHYTIANGPRQANGDWSIRLTPKAQGLQRFLSHIEVVGCERVAEVEVRQANGDWMEISLDPISR